jgi:hypothetical protein
MKRLIFLISSMFASCSAGAAVASPLEGLLGHCLVEGSTPADAKADLERQGWAAPSGGQLDDLAHAMAAFALFREDGELSREALSAKFVAETDNYRGVIDKLRAGQIEGLDGFLVAHSDGSVAELSWIVSEFASGPRVFASCRIFVPTSYQRTAVGQAVQNAANDPYLEQTGKSIGADIDVVEWNNFDNRSVGFRELSNLPNAGDRLFALNTVTSFSQ